MKVKGKQNNSRMCVICGMDNPFGVQAPFYIMEDDSVMTLFRYREEHQSYPGRVHGGLITAMLDELGFRAYWVFEPEVLAVTTTLETKYPGPCRTAYRSREEAWSFLPPPALSKAARRSWIWTATLLRRRKSSTSSFPPAG